MLLYTKARKKEVTFSHVYYRIAILMNFDEILMQNLLENACDRVSF